MSYDRADHQAALAERHQRRRAEMLPMVRMLASAAPVMDGLQRSPEWERYATILQGMLERYRKAKDMAQAKLEDPGVSDDKEVRGLRQDIFIANVTMETLAFAIRLPVEIAKGKEDADKFIAEFEAKDENAA